MQNKIIMSVAAGLLIWSGTALPLNAGAVRDAIWANGALYGTVGTPATFKSPPPGTTDAIFSFAGSGLEGQRSVSEAAPGDRDYNGGRWQVYSAEFTAQGLLAFDPDGDGTVNFELNSAEQVLEHAVSGDLTISFTGIYFECPLLPQRN